MIVPPCSRILSHAELQANRRNHGSPFFARHGFSVIELLIVVAILTLVSAFVLPAMRGPLDRSRLRSGAVDVQSAWGKARSFAIREGVSMAFRCRYGGRHWKIERDRGKIQPTSGLDFQQPSGFPVDDDQGHDQQEADSRQKGNLVREGWLPEGVTFADLTLDNTSTQRQDEFENRGSDEQPRNSAPEMWSKPLKFSPDGRSQDARLSIAGADDFMVHVKIRGLTSGVSFTAPFQRKQAEHLSGGRP
jgi:prepilin-type N-terminal cleavage/methylation domain-containing protein